MSAAEPTFPHCNPEVLHAPGTCWACDLYPDRQTMRDASGTPFTPAEANGWPGNVAQSPASRPRPAPFDWGARAPRPTLLQRIRAAVGL